MLYPFYLEIKNVLKKYYESLDLRRKDFILVVLIFFTLMVLMKILNTFNLDLIYIITFLGVVYVFSSFSGNNKILLEYINSDKFHFSRVFPISNFRLMGIQTTKFEIIYIAEYVSISVSLMLLLIITGYPPLATIFSLINITLVALCIRCIILILNSRKKRDFLFLKVTIDTIKIFMIFIYFHYITVFFYSLLDPQQILSKIKNIKNTAIFEQFFFWFAHLEKVSLLIFLILIYCLLIITRIYIYSLIFESQLNDNEVNRLYKIHFFEKILSRNIFLKKEWRELQSISFFNLVTSRIIAYTIFLIITITFNIKFNLSPVIILIISLFELIYISEKISSSYLGKEKGFITNYIFSNTSISKIILYKTIIHTLIIAIYITIINGVMIISFQYNLLNSINLIVILLFSTPTQVYISNFFNTYKTSYQNEFGIPNKKMQFIKTLVKSLLGYMTLSILTFVPLVFDNSTGFFIGIFSFLLLNISTLFVIYMFTIKKGRGFYGEYEQVYSKQEYKDTSS